MYWPLLRRQPPKRPRHNRENAFPDIPGAYRLMAYRRSTHHTAPPHAREEQRVGPVRKESWEVRSRTHRLWRHSHNAKLLQHHLSVPQMP